MTEAEWEVCTDPVPMLEFVRDKVSYRKLRLFACACCRRIWPLFTDEDFRHAVEVAERYADDRADLDELRAACAGAAARAMEVHSGGRNLTMAYAAQAVDAASEESMLMPWSAVKACRYAALATGDRVRESRVQCQILRDICGPLPFRLSYRVDGIDPHWRTRDVRALAETVHDEAAFDRLPIVGDALEEAGCTDPDLLAHCRGPGLHVRACWALDLVRGRS